MRRRVRTGNGVVLGARMAAFIELGAPSLYGLSSVCQAQNEQVTVGSKIFTESVILGEIAKHLLIQEGIATEHRSELGGSKILWHALLAGNIDHGETTLMVDGLIFSEGNGERAIPHICSGQLHQCKPLGSLLTSNARVVLQKPHLQIFSEHSHRRLDNRML